MKRSKPNFSLLASLKHSIIVWTVLLHSLFDAAGPGTLLNWRRSTAVGGPYEELFQPQNDGQEDQDIQSVEFRSGLASLQDIAKQAETDGKRLRAYGSKWSASNVMYGEEYLVESWGLNYAQVGFNDTSHTTAGYQGIANRLAFVQSGVMIKHLNQVLFDAGLTISTMAGGDGLRLVGAVSTGTYGAEYEFGSMEEFVRAVHIVLPEKHVVIQRASDPVVTSEFVTWLGGNGQLIEDDDMFNAAVVSFGSFGLIHAMIIETEPLFQWKCQRYPRSYTAIKDALNTLNVDDLLPDDHVSGNHQRLDVLVNPYNMDDTAGSVVVEACDKIGDPVQVTLPSWGNTDRARLPSFDEALNNFPDNFLFGLGATAKRHAYSRQVRRYFQEGKKPYDAPEGKFPLEMFTFPGADAPLSGAEEIRTNIGFAVPLDRTVDALEVIQSVFNGRPLNLFFGIRYIKQSEAFMSSAPFPEYTSTIGVNTAESARTYEIFDEIFQELALSDIPHSYHWGKYHPINGEWVPKSFGSTLTEWQTQRNLLLNTENLRDMFASEWLEQLGMYTKVI